MKAKDGLIGSFNILAVKKKSWYYGNHK